MYRVNHFHRHALIGLVALAAAGCAGSDMRSESGAAGDAAAAAANEDAYRARVDSFHDRLAATHRAYDTGEIERYRASRDSLVLDVNTFIRTHPHAENDPEFSVLLNSLSAMDTLTVRPETYTAIDDSVALASAQWPDLEQPASGALFAGSEALFPTIENSRVDFWLTYFTGPGRERFERYLYRMQVVRPTIESILTEMDLPNELICIALIESGFAMKAVSSAKAVGPWQFINGTARRYGLRVNWWYDERCDIVASTYAAGNYLRDLHSIWGDWFLAFAAYNCGEYRVARQVGRQKTTNFWELDLPLQTERYVPKFLAALYILRDPEKYGFTIPDVEPLRFDLVSVTNATDLDVLARCAGTTGEIIREMNPQLRRGATPPGMEVHLKVPHGAGETCTANLAALPPEERIAWKEHKVRKGDTLSGIATQYGTSIDALRDANNMSRKRSMLQIGQVLVIPVAGGTVAQAASVTSRPEYRERSTTFDRAAVERYAERASTSAAPPSGKKRIVYTVKPNDTLGEIAARHGTSVSRLRSWNDLGRRRHIYPGQKLSVYVNPSRAEEAPQVAAAPAIDEARFTQHRHVVERGDTFTSIGRRYSVSVEELLGWNGRSRKSVIRPGDVIVIWTPRSPVADEAGGR